MRGGLNENRGGGGNANPGKLRRQWKASDRKKKKGWLSKKRGGEKKKKVKKEEKFKDKAVFIQKKGEVKLARGITTKSWT